MDKARSQELLENALWKIECMLNFHKEEEFQNNFPRIREALALARQSAQALGHVNQVPEPALEDLVITIQADSGERAVMITREEQLHRGQVQVSTPRVGSRTSDWSDRATTFEFPIEALPTGRSRRERASRSHRLFEMNQIFEVRTVFQLPQRFRPDAPPAYDIAYPDGPPSPFRMLSDLLPPPSYEEPVYGPIVWPTESSCTEEFPNWNYRRPE